MRYGCAVGEGRCVALAQQATLALYWLAVCGDACRYAEVLLHAVLTSVMQSWRRPAGGTVAASRQQLRRALQRVRQVCQDEASTIDGDGRPELQGAEACAALRPYLQSLQSRDPQTLWALLRQPPVSASGAVLPSEGAARRMAVPQTALCAPSACWSGVVQAGGQLGTGVYATM